MKAKDKIKKALVEAGHDEGEVNAANIFNGYAPNTMKDGWHLQWFGRSNAGYLGSSVKDALETIDVLLQKRSIYLED